ncbi:MAG: CBS domain-containing protein [Beijerinckiaceae bacterium]|nr:CBS domain-containing protein [Beijerinckiaceae bacterium]
MTVRRILAAKGRDVFTVSPECKVSEAVSILFARRLGALVITDESGAVAGIVSERDIVRIIATQGPSALDEPVSLCMSSNVVTTVESATIQSVMSEMTEGRFRHLPVVDHGRLAGIVSIGDVVKHRLAEMEDEQQALREYIATA